MATYVRCSRITWPGDGHALKPLRALFQGLPTFLETVVQYDIYYSGEQLSGPANGEAEISGIRGIQNLKMSREGGTKNLLVA